MRRLTLVVPCLFWGCLVLVFPPGLLTAQTPSPGHSSHAAGRGMRWTPIATSSGSTLGGSGTSGFTPGVSYLVVDSLNMLGGGTDAELCANACFAGQYQQSTVPYYSLDVARNVTLLYNSQLASPRPVIFADVHISASSTKTLTEYDFQAKFNGATLTFLNGDNVLRFSAPSPQTTEVRLAGQFDNHIYLTQLDTIAITVTAVYSDHTTDQFSYSSPFVNLSALDSYLGRGWIVAGHQELDPQASGDMIITNGDGSAGWFSPSGAGTYLTQVDQDFSVLTSTGSGGSIIYTRTYPDSSRIQFNVVGQEIRAISSTNDTVSYGYSGGQLTQIYDPYRTYSGSNRSYITLHYTGGGFLDYIQEPGGNGTPGTGRKTNITITTGDSTLTAIQDPDGISTIFGYNSNKLLAKIINRRGDTTRYAYDTHSWLLDSLISPRVPIDAGGGSTTNQTLITTVAPWQTIGVPTSSTSSTPYTPALMTAIYATAIDPLGRKGTYTVTEDGNPLVVTGPLSQVTTITRDNSWTSLPVKTVYPTGGHDTLQFTANTPNLTYGQAAGDSAFNYRYGANGQIDSLWTQGELAWRAFLHSGTGLADSVRVGGTDSLLTQYTYDVQHRILTVRDINGHTTTYAYDANFGNVDSVIVPGAIFAVRKFDAFGRDTADFIKGATYWARTQYDTLNRVVKTWHRSVSGDTTAMTYDALFTIRVRTPGGSLYKATVNALGWPTVNYSAVDTTKSSSLRYDRGGRLTSWTNRRGQRIDIVYDSLGRMIKQSGTNIPTDTFTYASTGLIQTMQHGNVSLDSTFLNIAGSPDSIIHHLGGHRYAFLYIYNAYSYGQRASETITTDAGITFVTQAEAWRPAATSLDSIAVSPGSGAGSIIWTTNNGGDLTQIHFPVGATKNLTWTVGHIMSGMSLGSGGTVIHDSLSRNYTLDSLGRILGEWRTSGSDTLGRAYIYDGLGRLTKVINVRGTGCTTGTDSITGANYTCTSIIILPTTDSTGYDVAGNRTLAGTVYSTTGNELLAWPAAPGTVNYTYDADGNMITRTHAGVTDSLFWGATSILDSVHSGGFRRQYEYNSAGFPIRRSTNGHVDHLWLWNNNQLIADLDSTGTHRRVQYLYHDGTDQLYGIVTDSGGGLLIRYVQQDGLGNVTGIMRGNTLQQSLRYTAWGQIDAAPINTLADTNRLAWKGLMYEPDSTQLYFVRNRWYDPVAGRFISEDPVGITGGLNVYAFTDNDPINGSDPTGLWHMDCYAYQYNTGLSGTSGPTATYYVGNSRVLHAYVDVNTVWTECIPQADPSDNWN